MPNSRFRQQPPAVVFSPVMERTILIHPVSRQKRVSSIEHPRSPHPLIHQSIKPPVRQPPAPIRLPVAAPHSACADSPSSQPATLTPAINHQLPNLQPVRGT